MTHPLDPLLRPESIAVIGATPRPGAVGNMVLANLQTGHYAGRLYAVNPRHEQVLGAACYPDLEAVPGEVEHAIFAVGDERIETALDAAIARGVKAATIISSLILDHDEDPPLRERVRRKLAQAQMLVCGGNGMGFYNFIDGVWACGFETRHSHRPGKVALISHSGSGMSGILDCEERIDFSLAVSTGQELSVTMDQYLDFALEQTGTRVVGLFIETARNPAGLVAALQKAQAKRIPVVAIKVGRTELAAQLAVSHSGAMAGRDATYEALFERYGVQRVRDMDELATALIMFAQPHPVPPGGLVSIHDSGGERQLTIDLAEEIGVPLAPLSQATEKRLEALLDPGLPAVNPLDAWSRGGPDYHIAMAQCLAAMLADPAAAIGAVIHDRAPYGRIYANYLDYLRAAHAQSGKPAFLVANRQGTGSDPLVVAATEEGFPVLDGLAAFMTGAKCLFAYRDFLQRPPMSPPALERSALERWRGALALGAPPDESTALAMLADFQIPAVHGRVVDSERAAVNAALAVGFPVVLKTAAAGIAHKSERGGVRLAIADAEGVRSAYRELAGRLGARVLVAPMAAAPGVEMILGVIHDDQFGPVLMLGFGGIFAEVLRDVRFLLPPFDAAAARRAVDALRLRPLLDAQRGRGGLDIDAYCEAAARLSVLAVALQDAVREIDVNPIAVNEKGCLALDALVVTRAGGRLQRHGAGGQGA